MKSSMKRARKNAREMTGRNFPKKYHKQPKWKQQVKQIEEIVGKYDAINTEQIEKFSDIPLSPPTLEGLMKGGFARPTDIQKAAIPLALRGKDVLGAAKTGSGKTLAFLIPVLEFLWRERWSQVDGLGALIISPTRELAYQTFGVLRKIGGSHDFSAGLVIGGHDLALEQKRIQRTNIIICTPGRLLQHMDETPDFECLGLKLLVLDETDRIMDLGFRQAMKCIIENLPTERQTLLFSATQKKSVKDLAMLSLKDPEYISVHEESKTSTPYQLSQSYIICNLQDKLITLFSFIKSHLTSKMIVFMSSCKQVKFVYEAFRRFRPGVPLMALYGRQKQVKRVAIYNDYCHKKAAILLCTDIAARGLDFPSVDWVVQLDCPEDANTYIHRVGRTARYEKGGQALLFLLPSEETGMLAELEAKKIPIEKIRVNPRKMLSIQGKLNAICVQDTEMKQWAQKSFICYLRSVHLQSNKNIFDVKKLPVEDYAISLGLSQAPKIRFMKKGTKQGNAVEANDGSMSDEVESGEEEDSTSEKNEKDSSSEEEEVEQGSGSQSVEKCIDKKVARFSTLAPKRLKKLANDDLLTVKSVLLYGKSGPSDSIEADESGEIGNVSGKIGNESEEIGNESSSRKQKQTRSKYSIAKKLLNKGIKLNKHIKFEDDGSGEDEPQEEDDGQADNLCIQPVSMEEYETNSARKHNIGGINIRKAKLMMKTMDKKDRRRERLRIQKEHLKQRRKDRQKRKLDSYEDETVVTLGDEAEPPDAKKRKLPSDIDSEDSEGDHGQLLEKDEELALHLLKS